MTTKSRTIYSAIVETDFLPSLGPGGNYSEYEQEYKAYLLEFLKKHRKVVRKIALRKRVDADHAVSNILVVYF